LTKQPKTFLMRSVASIAQSVEQRIENPRVGGSIPPRGTIISFCSIERLKCGASNEIDNSLLVQLVERRTVNPYVAGSSPAKGAKFVFELDVNLKTTKI
jgi:hypothetical protein